MRDVLAERADKRGRGAKRRAGWRDIEKRIGFGKPRPRVPPAFWGDDEDARAAKAWIRARTNDKTDTPDAILLADVVYGENERIWRDLVKTLRSLARAETVVILVHARRGSGDGCKAFRGLARDAGFLVNVAQTKSEPKDGFVAVTVTYALRLVDADTANAKTM